MEPLFDPAGAAAPPPADLIKEGTTANFMTDVVEASKAVPVIVDFWAPWCGPCKQLGPILEKVVTEAGGKVRMVKIDIDKHPAIAQQLRIQSIPAVFAFSDGRPVDAFMGALPESEVRAFVSKLIGGAEMADQASQIAEVLDHADQSMAAGDLQTAATIYSQVISHEPANPRAIAGLAKCCVATGDLAKARQVLEATPEESRQDALVAGAFSALELAEKSAEAGNPDELRARVAADPKDHQARFDLAMATYGAGNAEEAIDLLLEIVKQNRAWNDEAARKQVLQFFEALGPTHPVTVAGRRKLSSLLFS